MGNGCIRWVYSLTKPAFMAYFSKKNTTSWLHSSKIVLGLDSWFHMLYFGIYDVLFLYSRRHSYWKKVTARKFMGFFESKLVFLAIDIELEFSLYAYGLLNTCA